jgi:hypothetical protein
MLTFEDRITIVKAVRAELSISVTDGKTIVDAAFRAGLGTPTASARAIEEAVGRYTPDGLAAATTALLLRLVPTPADPFDTDDVQALPIDQAQDAVRAWLTASDADDSVVIPYPNGAPGSTLTVGDLRRSLRSVPSAG